LLAGLFGNGLSHADDHDRMLGNGCLHFLHNGLLVRGNPLTDGGMGTRFVENGPWHARLLQSKTAHYGRTRRQAPAFLTHIKQL
jgi:hypothetical protein